jgi:hypothetical protein
VDVRFLVGADVDLAHLRIIPTRNSVENGGRAIVAKLIEANNFRRLVEPPSPSLGRETLMVMAIPLCDDLVPPPRAA